MANNFGSIEWYRMVLETIEVLVREEFPITRPNGPDEELRANLLFHIRENGMTGEQIRNMLRTSKEGADNIKVPEPEPLPSPDLYGPVSVRNHRQFVDRLGSDIFPLGCHFGEAFSKWLRDPQSVKDQLVRIKNDGYTYIRVWLTLGYYDSVWKDKEVMPWEFRNRSNQLIPATPLYYLQLKEFSQLLESIGLMALYSHGDLNSSPLNNIRDHFSKLRSNLVESTIFGIELCNEKWQNFPRSVAEDENFAVEVMKPLKGINLLNSAPPPGLEEEPSGFRKMVNNWFPTANVHGTREFGDPEKVLRRHFNYGYERGGDFAMISTEPGGPGQGVTVGRTDDVATLVGMHVSTIIGGSGTVYMSSNGVFFNGPIDNQPAYKEVAKLSEWFDKDCLKGTSLHGNRPDTWVTSADGFADAGNGYGRVDQLLNGSRGYAIAHGGKGSRRLRFNRKMKVDITSLTFEEPFSAVVNAGEIINTNRDCLIKMELL